MKSEQIINAMERIDDAALLEAVPGVRQPAARISARRIIIIAACLVAAFSILVLAKELVSLIKAKYTETKYVSGTDGPISCRIRTGRPITVIRPAKASSALATRKA